MGVFLFSQTDKGAVIREKFINFKNLGFAFITLFRCSTGEDWHKIMFDLYHDD